jgi:predicted O-linked N-acetylglucosamine transferase (SPINDLY family)/HPt (histidine-containing phosphotransfer) domain-containing protein
MPLLNYWVQVFKRVPDYIENVSTMTIQGIQPLASDNASLAAAIDRGEYRSVMEAALTRIADDESDARAHYFKGLALLGLRELGAACESLEAACSLAPDAPLPKIAAGAANVEAGNNKAARRYLEAALSLAPDDMAALYHLGRLDVSDSLYEQAITRLGRLFELGEMGADANFLMGLAMRGTSNFGTARFYLEKALRAGKKDSATRLAIAICHIGEGYSDLGFGQIDDLLADLPDDDEMLFDLAVYCQEQGSIFAAQPFYIALLDRNPAHIKACINYSMSLNYTGRPMEALYYLQQAREVEPTNAEVQVRIGLIQQHTLFDKEAAKACYEAAIAADANHDEALLQLASLLKEEGKLDDALALLQRAVANDPKTLIPYLNLADYLKDAERFEEALEVLDSARTHPMVKTEQWSVNLTQARASALLRAGNISAALEAYRDILRLRPRDPGAHSGMLFCLNYDNRTSHADRAKAYRDFDLFMAGLRPPKPVFRNTPDPERRLKVGYISGDLRGHSVGFFAEPILSAHTHQDFEIYCYANLRAVDAVTQRMMAFADKWRWVNDLSDDAVAEMIRMDGVDVLIDLSNHTAYNRLGTLARKPAPIQMTWIGMPTTTGMSAIDYRISDARMDPPGMTEMLHSEKLLRLPSSGWCYRPSDEASAVPVGPLPAEAAGHLTFASFNAFGKINEQVVRVWARLLNEIPNAVLYMATGGKDEDEARNSLVKSTFESWGFPVERLKLFGRKPFKEYFEFHNTVDIALDPFPYNGGTVTAHALWMGVPVLSLAGKAPIQRMVASMNTSVGIPEFIAESEDQYIDIAKRFANDLGALAAVRKNLRRKMLASPLMDSMKVTGELEQSIRQVWREWCEKQRTGTR